MAANVVPKDAATIMVVRDAQVGHLEVLMLRRNAQSEWVGGVHLFPGGAVDEADRSPEIAELCEGRDEADASGVLGVGGGMGFFVAAVRECYEEAGILLAERDGRPLRFDEPSVASRFAHRRRELNRGETDFLTLCREERLRLRVGAIEYFSHWVTPEGSPRRYDTRFFVTVLPEGQVALHDSVEVVDSTWIEPAVALELGQKREIELWLPTMKNLEAISRFSTTSELMAAAARAVVPTIKPRITESEGELRILLPGDEGYER